MTTKNIRVLKKSKIKTVFVVEESPRRQKYKMVSVVEESPRSPVKVSNPTIIGKR